MQDVKHDCGKKTEDDVEVTFTLKIKGTEFQLFDEQGQEIKQVNLEFPLATEAITNVSPITFFQFKGSVHHGVAVGGGRGYIFPPINRPF